MEDYQVGIDIQGTELPLEKKLEIAKFSLIADQLSRDSAIELLKELHSGFVKQQYCMVQMLGRSMLGEFFNG